MSVIETLMWWIIGICTAMFVVPLISYMVVKFGMMGFLMARHHFEKTIKKDECNGGSTKKA